MKKISTKNGKTTDMSLLAFSKPALRVYADEVNLDRALPDFLDGLKPVARRIAWAASQNPEKQLIKSARIVGETMGRFHPHGDTSIYGALVTMVQAPVPLVHGSGNWGNILAPAAAMRYTNARLSSFGRLGFDKDYMNEEVTTFVPNYDDKELEPLTIPFPLPVILFNGGEGMGYGMACCLPTFTPQSVVEVLTKLLSGEKLVAKDFARILKPSSKWGGAFVDTKANRLAWLQMFKTHKASVQYQSPLEVDALKKTIIINEWPDGVNPEKFIDWVRSLPETKEAHTSNGSSEFTIRMKPGYNSVQFEAYVAKIQKKATVKISYNINVTSRKAVNIDGVIDYEVTLHSMSIPQLCIAWLKARLAIEVKSLEFRIKRVQAAIAYSKLLIFAAKNLAVIVPIVQKSKTPKEALAKALDITLDEAASLLELRLRQLTLLDQNILKAKLAEQQALQKQLSGWLKSPKASFCLTLKLG